MGRAFFSDGYTGGIKFARRAGKVSHRGELFVGRRLDDAQ
jgi:hypothetical protein